MIRLTLYFLRIVVIYLLASLYINSTFAGELAIWSRASGDSQSSKYSNLDQINLQNIERLEKVWEAKLNKNSKKYPDVLQSSPIFSNNIIVSPSIDGSIIGFNPLNGNKIWETNLPNPVGRRGITSVNSKIYIPTGSGVYELEITSGKIIKKYGNDLTLLPPVIDKGFLYIVNLISGIEKYSLLNGSLIWRQKLSLDCGLARVWSGFSIDPNLNQLYISTANSGALRSDQGKNCLANSIISINTLSGEIAWKFQEFSHDTWDLDMVSSPIPFKFKDNSSKLKYGVIGLSKSGSIFIINANDGNLINEHAIIEFEKNKIYSVKDLQIDKLDFSREDLRKLTEKQEDYVNDKIKAFNAFNYVSSKLEIPVFVKGLHGGFEWPGASIHKNSNTLIATSNNYPWIIRTELAYQDNIYLTKLVNKNPIVQKNCTFCHGPSLLGKHNGELSFGNPGFYVPSIFDIGSKPQFLNQNYQQFIKLHKNSIKEMSLIDNSDIYIEFEQDTRMFIKILRKIYNNIKIQYISDLIIYFYKTFLSININGINLNTSLNSFSNDEFVKVKYELKNIFNNVQDKKDQFTLNTFWQPLTDELGFPITNAPWGKISAIDIENRKIIWSVPFGFEENKLNGEKYNGSRNFGGTIVTSNGIIFATGTVDEYARAYDLKDGSEVWRNKLPYAGSTNPITYIYNNCQYVLFTATGGRFSWFRKGGDSIVAYKLGNCELAQ
jgi:glucose dehydrogenase